jgi:hypothetical protein
MSGAGAAAEPNLDDETTYFFTVTAYTTGALESQMSRTRPPSKRPRSALIH